MPTGYEVEMYRNLERSRLALESIAASLKDIKGEIKEIRELAQLVASNVPVPKP